MKSPVRSNADPGDADISRIIPIIHPE